MRNKSRETLLKIVVGAAVALFLLDWAILSPAIARWKAQSGRVDALREKVRRGRQLVEREPSLRARSAEMLRTDLPEDESVAESEIFKGVNRWVRESRISLTNLAPQRRVKEEGYDLLEYRAAANGDQASLGRFLYELETDPLPARLDECEITTRDAKGSALSVALRFSFIRLTTAKGKGGK